MTKRTAKFFMVAIIGLWIAFFAVLADAQTDNTFYVKQFYAQSNGTVGDMVKKAQAHCNLSYTCRIVFDPSLSVYATGTLPAKCSSCVWEDWRAGNPFPSTPTTRDATKYSGDASQKINACIADAIADNGGVCDARGLSGTQAMSQQINVGNTAGGGVTLLIPATGSWEWNISNGTSCGIMQYTNTAIRGDAVGSGGSRLRLRPASSSSSMASIYCTDPNPTSNPGHPGSYIIAEGFDADNMRGATMTNGAAVEIQKLYDNSQFNRITAMSLNTDGLHIWGVCCGTTFTNVAAYVGSSTSGGSVGGHALVFGKNTGSSQDAVFIGGAFNTHTIGKYNILVQGGASTLNTNFYGTYIEGNGGGFSGNPDQDTTTPLIYVNGAVGTHFFGLMAHSGTSTVSTTKYVIENHAQGTLVTGLNTYNTTACINDFSASNYTVSCTPASAGNYPYLSHWWATGSGSTFPFPLKFSGSMTQFDPNGQGAKTLMQTSSVGNNNGIFYLDPVPADASSGSEFRLFRFVNTSAQRVFNLYKGDNTNTITFQVDAATGYVTAAAGATYSGGTPTGGAGKVGFGASVSAASSCGSLAGAAGCLQVSINGTTRYIPYY